MRKRASICIPGIFFALLAFLPTTAFTQSDLADQAVAKARAGDTDAALQLFAKVLAERPNDIAVLRDYAVVLGWAGKYQEAIAAIKKVQSLDNNPPDWALREFAAAYLFGDAKTEALGILNDLIARGDLSEQTLIRRALALRWMGQPQEAQTAYRTVLHHYPKSAQAAAGLAYSMADEGKLSAALRYLDSITDPLSNDPVIIKARIRLLNWSGRHYEAQTMIASLPANFKDDRDVLEDRIMAARWGGNPSGAMQDVHRLASLFPGDAANTIGKDLRTEYGQSFAPSFRFGKDSDGLIDRSAGGNLALHVNPAHVIHVGYQYRWLEQNNDVRRLLRYDLGWSGDLNRRLAFYATAGSVDYRTPGLNSKIVGDGTLAVTVNRKLRISGGGGSMAMDAYQSIPKQVTAPFGFGELAVRLNSSTRLQTRVSRYSFSDAVVRDRADFEFMHSLFPESRMRLSGGWRFNWMRHDGQTDDFWSPSTFHSHVAIAQSEGRLTKWLDYWGEAGAGWQYEPNAPVMHPFQVSGKLLVHPSRHWRLVLEAGRSTSSLDRVLPGRNVYSRWVAIAGMEFRFP